jgi:hypothetical protein
MCCTAGNYTVSQTTIDNTLRLCLELCKMIGISRHDVDKYVVRHYDVTHKNCPLQWTQDISGFIEFKNKLKTLLKETSFIDIEGHYAQNHINKLASYNVVSGYENMTFRPNGFITRAEFVTIIANVLEKVCGYTLKSTSTFSDISEHWAKERIENVADCGIINGFEDGSFKPSNIITRGQAAIIACNLLLYCGIEMRVGSAFPDIVGHYAERHIRSLEAFGIINGYEDGTFKPDDNMTRGQAAIVIANCLTILGK